IRRSQIISKYFLTGVTPAFYKGVSPLHAADIVSDEFRLHGVCGFTENEVRAIIGHYLRKDEQAIEPILRSMRRLYGGYFFAKFGYDESALLYNPHLVFHYLNQLDQEGLVTDPEESTTIYSTRI